MGLRNEFVEDITAELKEYMGPGVHVFSNSEKSLL